MVAVRKVMERFFSDKDLRYLDDKMPDFHLRKKEDLKKRKSKQIEEIEIDLDENQGTLRAVKTEAHLHIPLASGNVVKIPLHALQEQSHDINITKEMNSNNLWRHITNESKTSLTKMNDGNKVGSPRLATPEDDEEAITINVVKATPEPSDKLSSQESQPLLKKNGKDDESQV